MTRGPDVGSAGRRTLLHLSYDVSGRVPEEYLKMAHAFADSAVLLFDGMAGGRAPASFHHAKAAATLLEHGLELFLKGAMALAGDQVPRTHDTGKLLSRFRELYPGEGFEFSGRVDDIARDSKPRPSTQFTRYPTDRDGVPWAGHVHFDLGVWLEQARRFQSDYRRLGQCIAARAAEATDAGKD